MDIRQEFVRLWNEKLRIPIDQFVCLPRSQYLNIGYQQNKEWMTFGYLAWLLTAYDVLTEVNGGGGSPQIVYCKEIPSVEEWLTSSDMPKMLRLVELKNVGPVKIAQLAFVLSTTPGSERIAVWFDKSVQALWKPVDDDRFIHKNWEVYKKRVKQLRQMYKQESARGS